VFTTPSGTEGEEISLKKLKAIFFVEEAASSADAKPAAGRKIEVFFSDGERLAGATQGYTPDRLGFFLVPEHTGEAFRILRVFVVNANVKKVGWIR